MKRVEIEVIVKMIVDIENSKDIDTIVDSLEITEFEIDDSANIISANIIKRSSYNYNDILKKTK